MWSFDETRRVVRPGVVREISVRQVKKKAAHNAPPSFYLHPFLSNEQRDQDHDGNWYTEEKQ